MPDVAPSLVAFPDDLLAVYPAADLLWSVLETSLTGLALYSPLRDAEDRLVDFRIDLLNPAAQRMLGQPARPGGTYLQHYPLTLDTGVFAFHREAYESGEPSRLRVNYQGDGLDNYFHLAARRVGPGLLVSFTDTADAARTEVELALRASQAQEQAARQAAEDQRNQLQALVDQVPVGLGFFEGPELRVTAANQQICAMWGHASEQVQHRPLLDAVPELQGQGFDELLRQVMATEVPVTGTETPAQLLREGKLTTTYYDFVYKPLYDTAGQVQGVMNVAVEVTAQVVARQQIARAHTEVQNLNEKLAAINEELYASNEEYLMANTALSETQQQLRQLNEELEARVQQRTQELEASHQAAKALQAELLAAAQRRAQQREDLYQIFAQAPAVVVLLRGPAHRMEYLNAAAQQLFPGRQMLGQPLVESQPESVAQGFVALLDQVYQTGETYLGNEVPLTVQPGPRQPARTRYFNFSYQAYREQDQIAGVSVFAHDVTEQVLARREREAQQHLRQLTEELEARVAERTRQIEQQSARTTRLIQEAPAAIAMLDGPQLVFEVLNADYQALFPDRVLQGKPILEALPELRDGPGAALLRQVYDTGVTFEGRELLMHFARPGDGQLEARYFDFIYQARYDAAGEIDGLLLFGFEVTPQVVARQQVQVLNQELAAINEELTATNEELHTSNSQLVRTNADLDNFVYTASHDLKSPISNIEGLLALLPELLPEAVLTDEQVAPVLERMQESIGRFRRTITHLTDVSRLQAEFAQPAETVSLAAIIEDVRQDLHFEFLATGAMLDVAVNGTQPRVFSPKNLRSLIYNLVSNALKYRHPERAPRVRIRCQHTATSLVLTVQDNGLGLSSQQQQRLFQLFQRLHTHVEGSGVGLYAVKKIVENAGGTITVTSQENVGTTFTLTFPA